MEGRIIDVTGALELNRQRVAGHNKGAMIASCASLCTACTRTL
jgi:hypothetical protein